ncbi:Adenosine 3'-phospho 5'-phosphosulfate transporter 2-like [Homarus americanus]|uniref:Adenosine 3'-phospho 5'-phosphosulfate transporter 2 n=1 Tax=Homarus americanus TaxID=6706 RepID=A0A8J5TTS5_HOMAM|nr:Adenosine 3'-phospho 5'-phosphosulfate transporter 2-like [Homarus americanus]
MSKNESVSVAIEENVAQPKKNVVKVFGFPISSLPPTSRFILLSLAVFIFYLIYGYILELIFTLDGMRPHGWFLTLVQFAFYTLFALLEIFISGCSINRKIPLKTYVIIAILTVGTMGFSNSSVGYLNYPTQVIFKSCKLIPVMIGSMLILGKRYSFAEVVACLCMSLGLIWFTLADTTVQPNFSITALLCDAVIGNVQEGAIKKHKEDTTHVVLYSYSIGFFLIFIGLILTDQLIPAVSFASQFPWEVYGRAVLLSAAGFCGVQVVLTLVTFYGALVAVTVTTFRKAITICLSFILFSKPFTIQYVWGGLLVIAGIYLNMFGKKNKSSTPLLVSIQQIYMKVQQHMAPKVSQIHEGDRSTFNI